MKSPNLSTVPIPQIRPAEILVLLVNRYQLQAVLTDTGVRDPSFTAVLSEQVIDPSTLRNI